MANVGAVDFERALVTGGYGFIGSNLATALCEQGVVVTVLDNLYDEYGSNPANLDLSQENLQFVKGDVRNKAVTRDAIADVDVVFHLAAQLSRPRSLEEPHHDIDVNCKGTVTVLDAVREVNPGATVVFAGSQAEFGVPSELPLTEDMPDRPVDIYGANKLAAENYCRVYRKVHDIDATTLRLTNVYGQKANLQNTNYGVINKFIRLAFQDDSLTVFEPGDMQRDPVYVQDVVGALVAAATTPLDKKRGTYVIGSGHPVTIRELAEMIVDTVGSGDIEMVPWPDDWDSIRIGDLYADPEAAASDLNWEPKTSLDDGLKRTIEFYRRNRDDYLA